MNGQTPIVLSIVAAAIAYLVRQWIPRRKSPSPSFSRPFCPTCESHPGGQACALAELKKRSAKTRHP